MSTKNILISDEQFSYIAMKNEREGSVTPQEWNDAIDYINSHLQQAGTTQQAAVQQGEKLDDQKAGLIARSWGKTVDAAKWLWKYIVRFCKAILNAILWPFKKMFGKKAAEKKNDAVSKAVDEVVGVVSIMSAA